MLAQSEWNGPRSEPIREKETRPKGFWCAICNKEEVLIIIFHIEGFTSVKKLK
jgi:hypothetical protein